MERIWWERNMWVRYKLNFTIKKDSNWELLGRLALSGKICKKYLFIFCSNNFLENNWGKRGTTFFHCIVSAFSMLTFYCCRPIHWSSGHRWMADWSILRQDCLVSRILFLFIRVFHPVCKCKASYLSSPFFFYFDWSADFSGPIMPNDQFCALLTRGLGYICFGYLQNGSTYWNAEIWRFYVITWFRFFLAMLFRI